MKRGCVLITLAVVVATASWAQSQDKPKVDDKKFILNESSVSKPDWKNVGFNTPQATVQTFMWAMREKNLKVIRTCFDAPEKMETSETELQDLEKAGSAAEGFHALAIRRVDNGSVELKFEVSGWGNKPMVHKLRSIDGKWKLDTSSNTKIASW